MFFSINIFVKIKLSAVLRNIYKYYYVVLHSMKHEKPLISNVIVQISVIFFSLFVASVLIGEFISTFILSVVILASFSVIYSLVKIKKFGKELMPYGIKVGCILSLSFLTSLLFAIILPYLAFHNLFFNVLTVQYIYTFPVILVFLISIFLYSALINMSQIDLGRVIKVSLFFTVIISIILSLIYVFSYTYIYNKNLESYYNGIEQSVSIISNYETIPQNVKLELFDQFESYQNDLLTQITAQKNQFKKVSNERKLCLDSDCTKDSLDQAYHTIEIRISSTSLISKSMQAVDELNYIDSEGFRQNFTSLAEYKAYLINEVESLGSDASLFSNEPTDIIAITKSDITYREFESILQEKIEINDTPEGYSGYSRFGFIVKPQSLFQNSLSYAIKHLKEFKEWFNLITKLEAYAKRQLTYPDIFVHIFSEKDIEESVESKTIRYKLILNQLRTINGR